MKLSKKAARRIESLYLTIETATHMLHAADRKPHEASLQSSRHIWVTERCAAILALWAEFGIDHAARKTAQEWIDNAKLLGRYVPTV